MKGDFRLAVMMLIMQPQSTEEVARGLDSNALENVLAMPSNQHASYFSILTERWQDLLNTDGEYVEANDSNDGDRNLPERYLHRRQAVLQFLHGNTRKPKRSDLIPQIPRQLMQACAKEVDTVRRIITKSRRLEGSGRSAEDLSLDELNIDFQRIFSALPINIRHLYVNAYQSQLWNDMASEREAKAKRAPHAQEGELVLVDANKAPLTIWDVGPQNISLTANQIPLWSDDFLDDLSVDAKAYVHIVNAVEALTATYSLEALILPLPGHSTVIPAKMMKTLTSDDMGALIRGDHENTMYRLPGAYRHVFASARNVRTKLNVRKEGASPDSGDCGMDKERSSAYSHECDYSDARSGWVDLTGLPKNEKSEVSKGESEEGDDDDVSVVCDTLSTLAPAREPMHLRVERLWQEGSIQKLLNDIYAQPNLFDLDASLKESDRYIASTSEESAKVPRPRTKVPKASNASSLTVAFSLCSSGYATNYIDWILEETEKRLRRSKKAAKAKGKVSKTI
jgi:tRNA(Glu) U13 pseudouridine synthase TruD